MENAVLFRGVIGTWWTGYVFFCSPSISVCHAERWIKMVDSQQLDGRGKLFMQIGVICS